MRSAAFQHCDFFDVASVAWYVETVADQEIKHRELLANRLFRHLWLFWLFWFFRLDDLGFWGVGGGELTSQAGDSRFQIFDLVITLVDVAAQKIALRLKLDVFARFGDSATAACEGEGEEQGGCDSAQCGSPVWR